MDYSYATKKKKKLIKLRKIQIKFTIKSDYKL